jgi:S1-C subfamily serine protease
MNVSLNKIACPLFLTAVLLAVLLVSPRHSAGAEKTIVQIAEEQGKAVGVVTNFVFGMFPQAFGSGFLVMPNGVFITNFHVVQGASAVQLKLPDGREFAATGVIATSTDWDIAILKVEADGLPAVPLGDSDTVKVGERVIAIGSPLGFLEKTVSDGLISAIREDKPGEKIFQVTTPVSQGSSGGALLNMKGEVIGIIVASFPEGQNLNFAIPINYAKPLIRDGPIEAVSSQALVPQIGQCPVIGNIKSGIYHLPGGQFYLQMHVSPDRFCFKSEEEAIKAGFRPSLR